MSRIFACVVVAALKKALIAFGRHRHLKTACSVRSRQRCEECRNTLHSLLGPESLPDFYERIHFGRPANAEEVGRDAQDLEGACSWFFRPSPCVPG